MRMRLRDPPCPDAGPSQSLSLPIAGISRDSLHKRRETGGKQKKWRKKRKCAPLPLGLLLCPRYGASSSRSMTFVSGNL